MSYVFYNKRTFTNVEESHYTGSICCFDGIVENRGRPSERYTFIELADCYDKVRIHTDKNAGNEDEIIMQFIAKVGKIVTELQQFQLHLISTLDIKLPELEEVFTNENVEK